MKIRPAKVEDASEIAAIYNELIDNSTAVWKTQPISAEDRADWIVDRAAKNFPVLIAEMPDGRVAGYASYGPWREGGGYRHTVEHSVHVAPEMRGQRIGTELLLAIVIHAKAAGLHVMIAGIEAENVASIALHQKLGFVQAGTMRQVGTKFGRWLDLTIMQLTLD